MDFVDKIGEEVNKVAKQVTKGANNLVESTKLSLALSELEDKLKLAFESIGKKVYLSKTSCECDDVDFEAEILEISQLNEQICELKDRLADLRNKQKCSLCGIEVKSSDRFCRNCGNKLF